MRDQCDVASVDTAVKAWITVLYQFNNSKHFSNKLCVICVIIQMAFRQEHCNKS